jgi:hypothetical protein
MSYNKLKNFDFDWLDQVGTMKLLVNVSHNAITELNDNATFVNPREQGIFSTITDALRLGLIANSRSMRNFRSRIVFVPLEH